MTRKLTGEEVTPLRQLDLKRRGKIVQRRSRELTDTNSIWISSPPLPYVGSVYAYSFLHIKGSPNASFNMASTTLYVCQNFSLLHLG